MGEGEVEKTLHQLSPFFASIFLLFPRNTWYSGYFYFPDSSQISAMVGDHSRQIENSNLYRQGRRRWISHITNPVNCWAPVPLSRKFQFLAHFPFPAKFIGRIPRGGYSGFQVTGMIEGFLGVWNFRFWHFFGYENLVLFVMFWPGLVLFRVIYNLSLIHIWRCRRRG